MEDRNRLGRGLQEVSRFYLSDTPRKDPGRDEPGIGEKRRHRVVRVIHPGSPLMGAFFTANFSLELARHRMPVTIWDGAAREGEGVEAMLREIIHPDPAAGALSVRLYGLPDITVHRAGSGGGEMLFDLVRAARSADEGRWIIIDTPHCMNALMQSSKGFDAILLSTLEISSLLQCYAYVKVIGQNDPHSRISLVFIDPGPDDRAGEAFSRFSAFAGERLGASVYYLGHLARDEYMDRSISDHRPLVLGHEPSAARESVIAVSRAFLQLQSALPSGQ